MDLLLSLKMVAGETNHAKPGYFTAVLESLRDKLSVLDEQFERYVVVLLGDKDQTESWKLWARLIRPCKLQPPSDVEARFIGV